MRIHALTAAGVILLAGCAANPSVQTVAAPGFEFSGRSTFYILPVPSPRVGTELEDNDPMLVNSITNKALVADITHALEARGYRPAPAGKEDFDVAAYASANEALDIRSYDYGYSWRHWPGDYADVYTYEKGTVIIDLVDPHSKQLLWRGRGVAAVSEHPEHFMRDMQEVVDEVVEKLPPAGLPAGSQ